MAFKKAERTQLFLRCALFGPSGSGKTMTALRMAKGIAEKMNASFAVIDSEARSASKYSDRIPFDVENLNEKTVDHYIASMNAAKEAGYKVLVIDSLSHAWRELTEEVDKITQASVSKNSVLSWAKVNPKQKRLINAILNYPGHLIVTMRSKTEWVIGEGKNGKTAPEKLGLAPEQGKGIEYEFDLLVEMNQAHQAVVTKDRTGKFQDETIDKPGEDFGVALYEWLTNSVEEKIILPTVESITKIPASKPVSSVKPKKEEEGAVQIQREKIKQEIGGIMTSLSEAGAALFTEDEKEQARQIIKTAKPDSKGLQELKDLKGFLSDELSRRGKKAA